jgi:hypothetical protein
MQAAILLTKNSQPAHVVAEEVARGGEDTMVIAFGKDDVLTGCLGRFHKLVQEQLWR